MTEISTFIQDFHEAFGEKATLPILFYYSDTPVSFPEKTNGCMFKLLMKVKEGLDVALSADVKEYVERLDVKLTDRKYLNFVRIDRAASFDGMEGLLFFAAPDMLSGLATWAYFDNNAEDAVSAPFGAGCASVISHAVRENRLGGRRTFIGFFDPSVRPFVEANELSFVIPANRFAEMLRTMRECCLFNTPAWAKVRHRMQEGDRVPRMIL